MGVFETRVGVSNGNGGPTEWVDALVETGATWTVLPDAVLRDRVGVRPQGHREFTLADGRQVSLPVGQASLLIDGEANFCRVVFGEEGRYLLGATTLQDFGLIPDTANHRLVPAPKLYM